MLSYLKYLFPALIFFSSCTRQTNDQKKINALTAQIETLKKENKKLRHRKPEINSTVIIKKYSPENESADYSLPDTLSDKTYVPMNKNLRQELSI